jgi:hypothetical protein
LAENRNAHAKSNALRSQESMALSPQKKGTTTAYGHRIAVGNAASGQNAISLIRNMSQYKKQFPIKDW